MEVNLVRMQAEYHEDGKFQSHNLTSWPRISEMFLNNLPKMMNNASINWVMHPEFNWEYVMVMSKKIGELLWPTPQPFTQNGELCLICCSPFGLEGAWILGTCQHMCHPQCLIILMLARRRCSQCRAPFHRCLYKQFNLRTTMPQHWEYNMFNKPNKPQAWGVDTNGFGMLACMLLHGGVNMMNGNMTNP
jgi:hypothetical protein